MTWYMRNDGMIAVSCPHCSGRGEILVGTQTTHYERCTICNGKKMLDCLPPNHVMADRMLEVEGENTRLRAALALSDQPCAYCSLPADEWAKCKHGWPNCGRGDDAMGCPHLGAALELEDLKKNPTKYMDVLIKCNTCGKRCTSITPELGFIIRAYVECSECNNRSLD